MKLTEEQLDGWKNKYEQLSFYDYTIKTSTVTEAKQCNGQTVATAKIVGKKQY